MKTKTSSKKVWTPFSLRQNASRSFPLAPTLVTVALIAFCPLQTQADTIGLNSTISGAGFSSGNSTKGWAFTISSPVLVTQLGLWDQGNNGLNASHVVTIWTSTGTLNRTNHDPLRHGRNPHQRLPLCLYHVRPSACG